MKIKADDHEYEFPEALELGELRLLKRHFDLARPAEFDISDIDHLAGLLFVAVRRSDASLSVDAAIARVDSTKRLELDAEGEGEETEPERPTEAADGGKAKGKAGK